MTNDQDTIITGMTSPSLSNLEYRWQRVFRARVTWGQIGKGETKLFNFFFFPLSEMEKQQKEQQHSVGF